MQNELSQLKRYLHETLEIAVCPAPWDGSTRLPFFLRDLYIFFEVQLMGSRCLLMLDRGKKEQSPATVRKHMEQVQARWNAEIVYVRERITAYNRKRLIEQNLPFVVPGNQMYLPFLGIDLREHFKKLRIEAVKFSPSTQALVIHILLGGNIKGIVTPAEMARCLGYSTMTMTRAFDELESVGLGEIYSEGRERRLRFAESGKDIWKKAQPFFRSPVKKRIQIGPLDFDPPGPFAGLTALAHYSMLVEPDNPVFALSKKDWKLFELHRPITKLHNKEPGSLDIEVWSYAPTLFAKDKLVDHLSLYLSLKKSTDERVEAALEEMMKGQQW